MGDATYRLVKRCMKLFPLSKKELDLRNLCTAGAVEVDDGATGYTGTVVDVFDGSTGYTGEVDVLDGATGYTGEVDVLDGATGYTGEVDVDEAWVELG
ncbi:hypothetical protein BB558_006655, partial [Smittium angustum]